MLGILKHKPSEVEITVSNQTVIRVLALVIASFILLAAVKAAAHALTRLFIAFFLSLPLNAPVHWLAQRLPGKQRGSRTVATGISFLIVGLLLAGVIASVVPPLVRQTGGFIQGAPELVASAQDENTA